MATIEIYETKIIKAEQYFCVYCGFNMTISGVCTDCNEYKSAVTLAEYVEHNGHYPKPKLVK
jgi:predicted ATP-dependent serine protease